MDPKETAQQMRDDVASVQELSLSKDFEVVTREDCVKLEEAYSNGGMQGLKTYVEKNLNSWMETPVNIAVAGQSGSGKSSFINAVRGMEDDEHPDFAPVGITECTTEPKAYPFPNNRKVQLWDLPGAGTQTFKAATYAAQMDLGKYDSFAILSESRFTEIDKLIADEIIKLGKRFYFVRTKMDDVMRNERKVRKQKFDESKTKETIISDCKEKLEGKGEVYLIDSFEPQEYDFQFLMKTLVEDLPAIKQQALALTLEAKSIDIVAKKVDFLEERIKWVALRSATVGLIPIPGVSAVYDINIISEEATFQREQLGVDDESIENMAKEAGMTKKDFKKNISEATGDSVVLKVLSQGVDSIFKVAVTQIVASEGVESFFKTIPFLGWIAGSVLSGATTYGAMKLMLRSYRSVAEACLHLVKAELEKVKQKKD